MPTGGFKFFQYDYRRLPPGKHDTSRAPQERFEEFLTRVKSVGGSRDPVRLLYELTNSHRQEALKKAFRLLAKDHNNVSLCLLHAPRASHRYSVRVWPQTGPVDQGQIWGNQEASRPATLLTGDLGWKHGPDEFLRHYGRHLAFVQVLQVPHHGSIYSWADSVVHAVNPEATFVVQAGSDNSFHHPHGEVIMRILQRRPLSLCNERQGVEVAFLRT